MDLASMCSFLERPEDYQESFHTARVHIRELPWLDRPDVVLLEHEERIPARIADDYR
jgi:hypothetical protein